MIEKLKLHQVLDNNGKVYAEVEPDNTELREAINEIIDFLDKQIKDTDNVLLKSMRMEKEFAEDECKRLQQELTKTKQVLEIAINAMKSAGTHNSINCIARGEDPSKDDVGITINCALDQIKQMVGE